MYKESHSTRGKETAIQAMVKFDAVWHHADSLISEGEGGAMTSIVSELMLERIRRASSVDLALVGEVLKEVEEDLRSGDEALRAGVEVRERVEGRLVGDATGGSVTGKSPRGCCRVATIFRDTIAISPKKLQIHESAELGE